MDNHLEDDIFPTDIASHSQAEPVRANPRKIPPIQSTPSHGPNDPFPFVCSEFSAPLPSFLPTCPIDTSPPFFDPSLQPSIYNSNPQGVIGCNPAEFHPNSLSPCQFGTGAHVHSLSGPSTTPNTQYDTPYPPYQANLPTNNMTYRYDMASNSSYCASLMPQSQSIPNMLPWSSFPMGYPIQHSMVPAGQEFQNPASLTGHSLPYRCSHMTSQSPNQEWDFSWPAVSNPTSWLPQFSQFSQSLDNVIPMYQNIHGFHQSTNQEHPSPPSNLLMGQGTIASVNTPSDEWNTVYPIENANTNRTAITGVLSPSEHEMTPLYNQIDHSASTETDSQSPTVKRSLESDKSVELINNPKKPKCTSLNRKNTQQLRKGDGQCLLCHSTHKQCNPGVCEACIKLAGNPLSARHLCMRFGYMMAIYRSRIHDFFDLNERSRLPEFQPNLPTQTMMLAHPLQLFEGKVLRYSDAPHLKVEYQRREGLVSLGWVPSSPLQKQLDSDAETLYRRSNRQDDRLRRLIKEILYLCYSADSSRKSQGYILVPQSLPTKEELVRWSQFDLEIRHEAVPLDVEAAYDAFLWRYATHGRILKHVSPNQPNMGFEE
ncbi:hypothetical protein F5B19DRAFT_333125 [Rostrohypoxylon terebratum]|nr:hypothetical protein F5B19DRAFT_333125 [Rostrohypoxylon terebratum]